MTVLTEPRPACGPGARQVIRVPDFRMDAELTCVAGVAGTEEAVTPSMAGYAPKSRLRQRKRRDQALPKRAEAS
jgi:hypothetical protein